MDSSDILVRLRQLPSTFRRRGGNYTALESTMEAFLSRYTRAADGVNDQEYINQATDKWLDTFGLMFGIPRFTGENSVNYLTRIKATLISWRGTPPAIVSYLELVSGLIVTVTEGNTPQPNWSATLTGGITATLITRVNTSVNFVRPAGVPFNFQVSAGGLYASTINYLGRSRLTGSYLVNATKTLAPVISANTNNSQPLLPVVFLTDPTLNS